MPKYINRFTSPKYLEETIVNDAGTVGTIRVKPSSVLWKPSGAQKYYNVSMEKFVGWITDASTKATKTAN